MDLLMANSEKLSGSAEDSSSKATTLGERVRRRLKRSFSCEVNSEVSTWAGEITGAPRWRR